jgi:type IV pilus assembly protein PilB
VRQLHSCKQPHDISPALLRAAGFTGADLDAQWQPRRARGCPQCNGSGYRGRTGIYQVMPVSAAIEALILNQASTTEIAAQAQREGVLTLRQSGLQKVRAGLVSLDEILATT